MRGNHSGNSGQYAFIETPQTRRRTCRQVKSRKKLAKAGGHAEQAWIRNTRCQPVLTRGGTNCEIAAEAPPAESDAFRVDIGQRERKNDHRFDDSLPVRPKVDFLQDQHLALARPVEDQAVIAPATGRYGRGKV